MADQEVFDVGNGVPANFNDGTFELEVNGSSKGRQRTVPGELVGALLKRMAQTYGVRTFTAYINDNKVTPADIGSYELGSVTKIGIVAKDSRG
jgi:hypothetical protein